MFRALAVFSLGLFASSAAFGQVLYQPVQSQFRFGRGDMTYSYGGNDPRVHAMMQRMCRPFGFATNLHRFDGGNSFGQPSPMNAMPIVLTDCIPLTNAAWFGFTAADANNEARASAARHFRKADELMAAPVLPDGSRIVPPTPVPVTTYVAPISSGGAKRGQIIIIPKNLLDRKLSDFEKAPQKVAAAN